MGLTTHLIKHKEEYDIKYNFFIKLSKIIIIFFILYKGGFFECFF
jgi:hypothetical protein